MRLGCVTLWDTGSPQTFTNSHALKSMKTALAAAVVCERRTPPRSWGGIGKSPPLQTDAGVFLSVQFFHNNLPTASLAVWVYVVSPEAMQQPVILGRDSWVRSSDRSYSTLALARVIAVQWGTSRFVTQGSMEL